MANKKILRDFYGEVCVAGSIKYFAEEKSEERPHLSKDEMFSYNLTTILARDKEVAAVGVRLYSDKCIVYISKNSIWKSKDIEYINKIKEFIKNISKDVSKLDEVWERKDVINLFESIIEYYSAKYETRVEKLIKNVNDESNEEYILSFKKSVSIKVGNNSLNYYHLPIICSTYYEKIKNTATQEATAKYLRFLRHLKKVRSYYTAFVNITVFACNNDYKEIFSNMDVQKLDPIKTTQRITSWKKIIQMFIPYKKGYEMFEKGCLDDFIIQKRLKEIYDVSQLDKKINQNIYLHIELNILTKIVNEKYKGRMFIAVSKKYCYLCNQYIKFAQNKGYKIVTSETHNKIYHKWMLPKPRDTTFGKDAQTYIKANLDRIINKKVVEYIGEGEKTYSKTITDGKMIKSLHEIIKKKI
ncbi:hypothetical protein RclHR1_25350003 [Rhizophagus clarus]|uniref:Uncharacterized protein n=1 Tax=Rhizophagus clarus TaxID=94130 RepID=A0A2Z6QZM2_9GLOM|nr:hypothetical protein RclHR1_25350003 [Rhizophagus clarus]GES93884.1 hypothetical protein GLOIN_2v1487101 [Rhizophagus clarus]